MPNPQVPRARVDEWKSNHGTPTRTSDVFLFQHLLAEAGGRSGKPVTQDSDVSDATSTGDNAGTAVEPLKPGDSQREARVKGVEAKARDAYKKQNVSKGVRRSQRDQQPVCYPLAKDVMDLVRVVDSYQDAKNGRRGFERIPWVETKKDWQERRKHWMEFYAYWIRAFANDMIDGLSDNPTWLKHRDSLDDVPIPRYSWCCKPHLQVLERKIQGLRDKWPPDQLPTYNLLIVAIQDAQERAVKDNVHC